MNEILQQLVSIPIFSGLSLEQQKRLSNIALIRSYSKGTSLFSEGEIASGLYVVLEGRVKVYKLSPEGREHILHLAGPGETVGEGALFSGAAFPAYAEAHVKSRILFVGRDSLMHLIKKDPSFAMAMLGVLSVRLRRFVHLIEGFTLREASGRLASYLLFLETKQSGKNFLILDITKGNLANILGTAPETLSRILGKMEDTDLIEVKGAKIVIRDRTSLQAIADGEKKLT
ncbi:MAG: Crp/Fnr family transcriptional regulator [Syntrophales bacterium]|nr:Crp/Fnr family transcriptional regulator [Syntrophales bacterium]MDY0043594.1 Crp/Fnr family transcriptional regulator [Syntrophales bacterium]